MSSETHVLQQIVRDYLQCVMEKQNFKIFYLTTILSTVFFGELSIEFS